MDDVYRPVVVAVIPVRMMEVPGNQEVDVVAVGNLVVPAIGPVFMR
jgi:hypothetical protein